MKKVRRVISDALGGLFDVSGNFMGVLYNFIDVPGILIRALLKRGLSGF